MLFRWNRDQIARSPLRVFVAKGTKQAIKLLAIASTMGISMVLATVIGLAIGYYLDVWLGTKPWLLLTFLLIGIVAGFRNLYVIMKKVQKIDGDD